MNEMPHPLWVGATTTVGPPAVSCRPGGSPGSWPSISCVGSAEGPELVGQRVEVGDLAGRAEALEAVEVHHDRQVGEAMMQGEDQRLPARALVPLAVGHQAVDPARLALEPLRQRQAGRQREAVPQAAGREQDPSIPGSAGGR